MKDERSRLVQRKQEEAEMKKRMVKEKEAQAKEVEARKKEVRARPPLHIVTPANCHHAAWSCGQVLEVTLSRHAHPIVKRKLRCPVPTRCALWMDTARAQDEARRRAEQEAEKKRRDEEDARRREMEARMKEEQQRRMKAERERCARLPRFSRGSVNAPRYIAHTDRLPGRVLASECGHRDDHVYPWWQST
jgi:hypothetical protein